MTITLYSTITQSKTRDRGQLYVAVYIRHTAVMTIHTYNSIHDSSPTEKHTYMCIATHWLMNVAAP